MYIGSVMLVVLNIAFIPIFVRALRRPPSPLALVLSPLAEGARGGER